MKTTLFDRLTPEAMEKFNSLPEQSQLEIREILDKNNGWTSLPLDRVVWLAFRFELMGFNVLPFMGLFNDNDIQEHSRD